MRLYLAALVLCATVSSTASAVTMRFDFGNNARQTADVGWNNVVYANPDPPIPLFVVIDSNGIAVPGVTLEVTDQFFINGQPSQGGTENPMGDAAGYPVDATDDYFFGHTGAFAGNESTPTGGFKLTGLDQSESYDFTFLSARTNVGDLRETSYSVTGANSASGVLEAANNNSEVLTFSGMIPDANNEIAVEVSAGPNNSNSNGLNFYYINLMEVSTSSSAVPEPTSALLLLSAVGCCFAARRNR